MILDFRDNAFLAVDEVFRSNPRAVMISNDMGALGLNTLKADFPDRVINGGISEQNLLSMAGGLASEGHPTFLFGILPHMLFRCYEQLRCDVCLLDLPVIVLASGAGLAYGADGPTHHGITDIPVLRSLPNLQAYTPSDGPAARGQILAAARRERPAFIRLDKIDRSPAYGDGERFESGLGLHGAKSPGATAVVTSGTLLAGVLKAAATASANGAPTYVVDVYAPVPFPKAELCKALEGAGRIIVVDEHVETGGLSELVNLALIGSGSGGEMIARVLPDQTYLGVTERDSTLRTYGLDESGLTSLLLDAGPAE